MNQAVLAFSADTQYMAEMTSCHSIPKVLGTLNEEARWQDLGKDRTTSSSTG